MGYNGSKYTTVAQTRDNLQTLAVENFDVLIDVSRKKHTAPPNRIRVIIQAVNVDPCKIPAEATRFLQRALVAPEIAKNQIMWRNLIEKDSLLRPVCQTKINERRALANVDDVWPYG